VPLTLLEVLRGSSSYLSRAGIERPRLDAEVLLAHLLQVRRIDLYLQFERPLTDLELTKLRSTLRLRARGTPVAYLVGEREFYGLSFIVKEGVLIPRPESELVVELALADPVHQNRPRRVADLGTGSGCIGIAIAVAEPLATVDAVDISEVAVEVARDNANRLGVGDRVSILRGSWGEPLAGRGPYDVVVCNPPYVTSAELEELESGVREFEPSLALDAGRDGLAPYRELTPDLPKLAGPGATVLLEVDPRRAVAVAKLVVDAWPVARTRLHLDHSQRERVVEVDVS
jgi:release factor glutamine methyltransferase